MVQLKQKQAEEAAARDAEAAAKAEARIKAALEANRTILIKRRQDFDAKQAENEERRRSVQGLCMMGSKGHAWYAAGVQGSCMMGSRGCVH